MTTKAQKTAIILWAQVKREVDSRVSEAEEISREQKEKFDEEYKDAPAFGLEWADKLYEAGAKLHVWHKVGKWSTEIQAQIGKSEDSTERFLAAILAEVVSSSRAMNNSTSPSRNFFQQQVTCAWAEVYSNLTSYTKYARKRAEDGMED